MHIQDCCCRNCISKLKVTLKVQIEFKVKVTGNHKDNCSRKNFFKGVLDQTISAQYLTV